MGAKAQKRVAVIGAGPAGLVTVKELLAEGHDPVCFERAPSLGGVYRPCEHDGVAWESVRMTSSAVLTAFSDFPPRQGEAGHLSAAEYRDYLAAYCEAFGVTEHIRFGVTVESVSRRPDGAWAVATVTASGSQEDHVFDAVAVCSGLNQRPWIPDVPGRAAFAGTAIHASEYRSPAQLQGKRVLVVGAGESGADIAAEAAKHARATVISLRRGVAVRPRTVRGLPNDHHVSRLNHTPPHWIYQTRHPDDDPKRRAYRAAFFPFLVVERLLQSGSRLVYETLPLADPRRLARGPRRAVEEARTTLRARRLMRTLLRESGGRVLEQFGTKSDEFLRDIVTGRCRRVGEITRFDARHASFADGSRFAPDVVIFCTGFVASTPIVDDELACAPRFLHVFNPAVGESLGFIGFIRPAHGAIPPLAELQARWFALVQSGAVELPAQEEQHEAIARETEFHRRFLRALDHSRPFLVDYTTACDALAEQVGCKPTRAALRGESRAFRRRFFAAPFVAAQYRLVGPHAKPELARRVIASLPVAHPPPMLAAYHLHLWLSRLLQRALGPEYGPKLDLKAP